MTSNLPARIVTIHEARALIADDAYAMTFQTLGQYRTALLRDIAPTPEKTGTEVADRPISWHDARFKWGDEV